MQCALNDPHRKATASDGSVDRALVGELAGTSAVNAMTVDVEDYFQVSAFEDVIPRADWERLPHRVERNTRAVLELFDDHRVSGTFFVLGWVAQRYPMLIRELVSQGHELASHGYEHVRVTEQSRAAFCQDIRRTKSLLEDIGGVEVKGYRAASYSIGRSNLWALDELEAAGYRYSSSIYPIHHDLYGMPEAPRFAFSYRELLEVPISTVAVGERRFPCGGGGFFRLYPYALSRWALNRVNAKEGRSCIFYFHPWEIDPQQPRQQNIAFKTRFRHYLNLTRMESRLRRLLNDFAWDRMDRVFLPQSGLVS